MPIKVLDQKKVLSLQKKYVSIPDNELSYYPDPVADDCNRKQKYTVKTPNKDEWTAC